MLREVGQGTHIGLQDETEVLKEIESPDIEDPSSSEFEKLRRRDIKPVDKTPHTYVQRTFYLDGPLDLDVIFDGRTMTTPIYVKMVDKEQLLISEGVCRQLGIVKYHKEVPGDTD